MKEKPKERKIDWFSQAKQLILDLEQAGFKVRREKLKQGPGWKTISGTCRVNTDKIVFLDSGMPHEEQVVFLRSILDSLDLGRTGGVGSLLKESTVKEQPIA